MNGNFVSWEEAVLRLKSNQEMVALVRDCYYDDPLAAAAQRFAESEEWQAVRELLQTVKPGLVLEQALDLGAGRGISSYALAQLGLAVFSLEPDPSAVVGVQAIRQLSRDTDLAITVIQGKGEAQPFADAAFDLVYGRQVLHHAADLGQLCREVARVLRPGGIFLATREHVISQPQDLETFLNNHPLHLVYGGENAYTLKQYRQAITGAGLTIRKTFGPYDSVINYFPLTRAGFREAMASVLARVVGKSLAARLARPPWMQFLVGRLRSLVYRAPGRLYSFVASK